MLANLDAMRHHAGPFADHWLQRMRATFGIVDTGRGGE
jgi:hypothetical protein